MDYAVMTSNLTKTFGKITAVHQLNLKIRKGEIFGLLGPNGAGKTTTIRIICGILKPTSGEVNVYGYDVFKNRKKALRIIGYVPQRFSLYEDLTVYENFEFFASLYDLNSHERKKRIEELLDRFLLKEYRNMLAGQLSGGTKQRLSLAISLIHRPKLLILDEPTAGMDPNLRRIFWNYFRELNKEGVTILITTHYMDEAEYCDRLALMSKGKIVAEGQPIEVKRKAFEGDIVQIKLFGNKIDKILNKLPIIKRVLSYVHENSTSTIKIVIENSERDLVRLVKSLEDQGVRIESVSTENVSLEDAFIKLTSD